MLRSCRFCACGRDARLCITLLSFCGYLFLFSYIGRELALFARDARVLLDAGYAINSMRAFDMFPNTAHIEMVTSFSR